MGQTGLDDRDPPAGGAAFGLPLLITSSQEA